MPERQPRRRRRVPPPPPPPILEGEEFVVLDDDDMANKVRVPSFVWILLGVGATFFVVAVVWLGFRGENIVMAYKTRIHTVGWVESPEFEVDEGWYLSCDQLYENYDMMHLKIINVETGEKTSLSNSNVPDHAIHQHDKGGRFKVGVLASGKFRMVIFQHQPIPMRQVPNSAWILDY